MKIIPAINCSDFDCVKEKLKKSAEIGVEWVQLDIADGKFAHWKTWNNPEELYELRIRNNELGKINIEIHLMVENPLSVIDEWIKTGARRVIVHVEAIKDKRFKIEDLKNKIEIGLAINPNTSIENLIPYLSNFKFAQILAVEPGLSAQKFQPQVLEKIKFLKKNYPDVMIEVDGGINLKTAKMCKDAGADILAAGSYIWDSQNPPKAFNKLQKI